MKKFNAFAAISLILISLIFSSCTVIGGIFKAGMGFGIIIAIAAAVFLVFIFMKTRKNK